MLGQIAVDGVHLERADIRQLPFTDGSFSHVVSVSVLEHLQNLGTVLQELRRVTEPDGWLVVGVPVKNWITRQLFAAVGYDDDAIHPSSHRDVLRAASPYWSLRALRVLPAGAPMDLGLYMTAQFQARRETSHGS
jgi:ubiquinone/menaquinone biosynthesis C-methylase UbiE